MDLTSSERFFLINTFLRGSPESVDESLNFILEHFITIHELIPDTNQMIELFEWIRVYLTSTTKAATLRQIEDTFVDVMEESLRQTIRDEWLSEQTIWLKLYQNRFEVWLNQTTEPEPEGGQGHVLKAINWILLTVFVVFLRIVMD